MNRRDFLKLAGLGAAGWVLAGCGIQSRREAFEEKQLAAKRTAVKSRTVYCRIRRQKSVRLALVPVPFMKRTAAKYSGYLIMPPTEASIWSIRSCRIFLRRL